MGHELSANRTVTSLGIGEFSRRTEREQSYPTFDKLIENYLERKAHRIGCYTEIGKLLAVRDLKPYNGSMYFDRGRLRFLGRIDEPNTEIATTIAFDPTRHGLWSRNGFMVPMLEDPRPTMLGNQLIVQGTGTERDEAKPTRVGNFGSALVLQAPDGSIQRYEFARLRGTKDMSLQTLKNHPDGSITVSHITRNRKDDLTGTITCTIHQGTTTIRTLEELDAAITQAHGGLETTLNAGIPTGEKDRWFGFMQQIPLVNGHMGILSHDAVVRYTDDPDPTKPKHKERIYVTTTREYDKNWKLVGEPQIISIAEDYPRTKPKWEDLDNAHIGMNLIYGQEKDGRIVCCTLVGGLRDTKVALGTLSKLPFSAEPDPKLNELYIGDINTLQRHDIPVLRTSLALVV